MEIKDFKRSDSATYVQKRISKLLEKKPKNCLHNKKWWVRFLKSRCPETTAKSWAGTNRVLFRGRECHSMLNLKSLTLLDTKDRHRFVGTNLVTGRHPGRPGQPLHFTDWGDRGPGTLSFQQPAVKFTPRPCILHQTQTSSSILTLSSRVTSASYQQQVVYASHRAGDYNTTTLLKFKNAYSYTKKEKG